MTSTTSGNKFEQAFEGTEGVCDADQAINLAGSDCIQMLNLITDADGNTVKLAFRRSG